MEFDKLDFDGNRRVSIREIKDHGLDSRAKDEY